MMGLTTDNQGWFTHKTASDTEGSSHRYGKWVQVGKGVPSAPVLDSEGKNVIVQVNGQLKRVPVSTIGSEPRGWKIR